MRERIEAYWNLPHLSIFKFRVKKWGKRLFQISSPVLLKTTSFKFELRNSISRPRMIDPSWGFQISKHHIFVNFFFSFTFSPRKFRRNLSIYRNPLNHHRPTTFYVVLFLNKGSFLLYRLSFRILPHLPKKSMFIFRNTNWLTNGRLLLVLKKKTFLTQSIAFL